MDDLIMVHKMLKFPSQNGNPIFSLGQKKTIMRLCLSGFFFPIMYSRFGEKTNNLQECLPPRQTRLKQNASGFEKDLVPGTD